jgi:trehalose utilization protein
LGIHPEALNLIFISHFSSHFLSKSTYLKGNGRIKEIKKGIPALDQRDLIKEL